MVIFKFYKIHETLCSSVLTKYLILSFNHVPTYMCGMRKFINPKKLTKNLKLNDMTDY